MKNITVKKLLKYQAVYYEAVGDESRIILAHLCGCADFYASNGVIPDSINLLAHLHNCQFVVVVPGAPGKYCFEL